MSFEPIEDLEVFSRFEENARWAWNTVTPWSPFHQQTLGKQLVRAADSIGANMVEGEGRQSSQDSIRFLRIALGSAKETRLWIQRCKERGLIDEQSAVSQLAELNTAIRQLNRLIQVPVIKQGVREESAVYQAD